ncbi:bifunctional GINS subunit [Babesia duncani]|uniref:Bifunctional GINS subunit n=1 Tax=Babesia duncani TaxID=323732 RepID=A0AAD9UNQ3_9APIC|nr:bifunctional GINS subunit [Babesia duncani]
MLNLTGDVHELVQRHSSVSQHVDFVKVPCTPTKPLPGLVFLSPKAMEELKSNARKDELLPGDELELFLFYAKHLYKQGACTISFPNFYKSAAALIAEATATSVGSLSPFYFQLGYELCNLLPETQWPVANLQNILKEAERIRRCYLVKRRHTIDDTFLMGLTHNEKKRLLHIQLKNSISLQCTHAW